MPAKGMEYRSLLDQLWGQLSLLHSAQYRKLACEAASLNLRYAHSPFAKLSPRSPIVLEVERSPVSMFSLPLRLGTSAEECNRPVYERDEKD